MFKKKLKLFGEKFGEAWTACSLMMVQGDLSVFTLKHASIAAETGVAAGLAVVVGSYWERLNTKYGLIWLTGIATALVDIMVHPTHFGPEWAEALLTGAGAGLIAWGVARVRNV